MDMYAARDTFVVLLRQHAKKELLNNWRNKADFATWRDPSSSNWKYPRAELPVMIDKEGEEVSENIKYNIWWEGLVAESNKNLSVEDNAASTIIAALKGLLTRRFVIGARQIKEDIAASTIIASLKGLQARKAQDELEL